MNALIAQLKYRSKAVITAVGAILGTAVVAVILDPTTEHAIVQVVPAQYQVLATLVFGAIVTAIVHRVPLGEKPATTTDEAPVTELSDSPATTMIPTITNH